MLQRWLFRRSSRRLVSNMTFEGWKLKIQVEGDWGIEAPHAAAPCRVLLALPVARRPANLLPRAAQCPKRPALLAGVQCLKLLVPLAVAVECRAIRALLVAQCPKLPAPHASPQRELLARSELGDFRHREILVPLVDAEEYREVQAQLEVLV